MNPGQGKLGNNGAQKGGEHVPLGIPGITLGTEESFGALAEDQRSPPLDEFVTGAHRQADRRNQKEEPASTHKRRPALQDFTGKHGRNETLGKVTDTVIGIAGKAEQFLQPVAKGNFRIGVMAADKQDDAVKQNQPVEQRGEGKAPPGGRHDAHGDEKGEHLQHPGQAIMGIDDGGDQANQGSGEIDYGFVGDIKAVNYQALNELLTSGAIPVVAPITHDGHGQLLNTNADTIASELAMAMSYDFEVQLIFCLEKSGVLMNEADDNSRISEITPELFVQLKADGIVTGGMIPKLSDGFAALNRGVGVVVITNPAGIKDGLRGTRLVLA